MFGAFDYLFLVCSRFFDEFREIVFALFCIFHRSAAQRYRLMKAFFAFLWLKTLVVSRETFALRAFVAMARATEVFLFVNKKTCFSYVFALKTYV